MHLQANLSEVTGLNIKHRPIEPKDIHIKNDTNKRVQNYAEGGGKPSAEELDSINETQKEKQHSKNKNSQKHINFAEEGRVDNRKPVAKKKSALEGLIEDTDPRIQMRGYINSKDRELDVNTSHNVSQDKKSNFKFFGTSSAEASAGSMAGYCSEALIDPTTTAIFYGAKKIIQNAGKVIPVVGALGTVIGLEYDAAQNDSRDIQKYTKLALHNDENVDITTADLMSINTRGYLDVDNPDDLKAIYLLSRGRAIERGTKASTDDNIISVVNSHTNDQELGICKAQTIYSAEDHNAKKITSKQQMQMEGIGLYGINPGNIREDKGVLRIDTELAGGDIAARECFKNLTGFYPKSIKQNFTKPDGTIIYYRTLGDSGHSKVEINGKTTDKIHEKITFK